MRVAHILRKYQPSAWGGMETAVYQLTDGLSCLGVESVVFCPEPPDEPANGSGTPADPPDSDTLRDAGCAIRRFRARLPIWGLTPENRRQAISVGGNLLSFDLPRKLAREPEIEVIHTHALGRLAGIALTAARRRGLPFVVTIHGGALDLPDEMARSLNEPVRGGIEWGRVFGWWWGARRVLSDADAILVGNAREADLFRTRYPDKRIILHPYGVETPRFEADRRTDAQAAFPAIAGRQVLLCVGRIDPQKNQSWLVHQMPRVIEHHPDALLVLAGSCTNQAYGEALGRDIDALGVRDHVLFTGGLPPGDPRLIGLLQEARIKVLPSIAETFGLVILEAWAAGTPVLASPTSGAKALVRNGENGWLFDPNHPRTFHEALDRTLADPDLAACLGAAGRRTAESEYDTIELARNIRETYADLVAQSRRTATRRRPQTEGAT